MTVFYWIINGFVLAMLALIIKRKHNGNLHSFYWPALLLKIIAGVALGWIYAYFYSQSDTWNFFHAAVELATSARLNFSEYLRYIFTFEQNFLGHERSVFLIKLISIINLATNDHPVLTSFYFSLFSFAGSFYLVSIIARYYPQIRYSAVLAFLFFPSAVFWSSGIIKETIAMPCLYYCMALFLIRWHGKSWRWYHYPMAALAIFAIYNLKYYYLAVFLPISGALLSLKWITKTYNVQRLRYQLAIFAGLFIVMLLLAGLLHPNLLINRIPEVIVSNYNATIAMSDTNDVIHFQKLEPVWFSIILNIPKAIFSGLFRPFPWEADHFFKFAVAVERTALFIGILLFSWRLKDWIRNADIILFIGLVLYCLSLCALLTMAMPNFGTLVRYAVAFYPFVVMAAVSHPAIQSLMRRTELLIAPKR